MRTLVFFTALGLCPVLDAADKPAPHTLIIPADAFRPVAVEAPESGQAKQAALKNKRLQPVRAPEPDPLVAEVANDGSLILGHKPAAAAAQDEEQPE